MKKLSRIPGYRDSEIKRFNKIYECLIEKIADTEDEMTESFYSQIELEAFRKYLVLAEADERKRRTAFSFKRMIYDFTPEEISRFDHMQEVLTEFNRLLDDPDIDMETVMPFYSDVEMAEHSQYREILLGHQFRMEKDE